MLGSVNTTIGTGMQVCNLNEAKYDTTCYELSLVQITK